jgi:hypothetical protein
MSKKYGNNNKNNSTKEMFLNLIVIQSINKISSFMWLISVSASQILFQFSKTITLIRHHYKHNDFWDDGDNSIKCNDNDNVNVTSSDVFAKNIPYLDKFKDFYLNNN